MSGVEMLPPDSISLGDGNWYVKMVDKDDNWVAITQIHLGKDGNLCAGYVGFEGSGTVGDKWTVVSREPLTLSPSLLCGCGHHGFITEGKWVPA